MTDREQHQWPDAGGMAGDDRWASAEPPWRQNPVSGEWEPAPAAGSQRTWQVPGSRFTRGGFPATGPDEYTGLDDGILEPPGGGYWDEPEPEPDFIALRSQAVTAGAFRSPAEAEADDPFRPRVEAEKAARARVAAARAAAARAAAARAAAARVRAAGARVARPGGKRRARPGRERQGSGRAREMARSGASLLTAAAVAAAFCVAFVVTYGASTRAAGGNGGSGPNAAALASITHLKALASQYQAIADMANQQLGPDMASFNTSQDGNLAAAKSALSGEVTVSRLFDASLVSWLAQWKQGYAAAQAAQHHAPFPVSIPYPASVTGTGQALLQADQERENLLVREHASTSLGQLKSFGARDQSAQVALANQVAALRTALQLPAQ